MSAATSAPEDFFTASDGAKIFVRNFTPPNGQEVRAVVHIHHGMSEHSARYAAFAEKLVEHGMAVVVHDARGHGRTAEAEGAPGLGHVQCGAEGSVVRVIQDFKELIEATLAARPNVPILVFGHSFGTVVSQTVLGAGVGGANVRGLLLCAPPARLPGVVAGAFKMLLGSVRRVHGAEFTSVVPGKLCFDKYNKLTLAAAPQQGEVTGWEWLNRDPAEVKKYIDDPQCGQLMSLAFWIPFIDALQSLKSPAAHAALSPTVKVCVIAGTRDFCTADDFGRQSHQMINGELTSAGKLPPKVVMYPEARHELLLELNKDEVMTDAVQFFSKCLDGDLNSKM